MIVEVAAGIYGGEKSLEAYLFYMGVGSLEELEEEEQQQLCLFPYDEEHERPSAAAA